MKFAGKQRDEEVFDPDFVFSTVGEKWNVKARENHWYSASTEFSVSRLGQGRGRSCLVVGSPFFEIAALTAIGWDVSYLDIRTPKQKTKFIRSDAMDMNVLDKSFDALSSACVLTHVGTGRYGDTINPHGDEIMLSEVWRVLKDGAYASLTFGACADIPKMIRYPAHRIYSVGECKRMLAETGFSVCEMKIWSNLSKDWLPDGSPPTKDTRKPDYISFLVQKCGS